VRARLLVLQVMSAPHINQQAVDAWNMAFLGLLIFVMVVIIELLIGGTCGKITESAGHTFLLGFTLGFLLCVAGIALSLLLYLFSGKRPLKEPSLPPFPAYSAFDYLHELPPLEQAFSTTPLISRALPIPPPQQAYSEGVKMCPNCQTAIPIISDECWNCGVSMVVGTSGKSCRHCFTLSPHDAGVCVKCGMHLDDNPS
jgi:hypothetical protein